LALGLALAVPRGWARGGLGALPALLASIEAPPPPPLPLPPGPIALQGPVARVSYSPTTATTHIYLGHRRTLLRVTLSGRHDIVPGDRVVGLAAVAPLVAPDLPPTVRTERGALRVEPGPWSLRRATAQARHAGEGHLLAAVPGAHGAMLAALVLGRDTRPAADLVQAHQATGLSHLLAVSGAHAAMLASLLGLAVRRRSHHLAAGPRRTLAWLSLLLAYAAMTGGEPPVLRAVVAVALAAIAAHTGRPFGLAPALLAPALLTVLLEPSALRGPSFLLSYAAVVGLALAGSARNQSRLERWCWNPLRASAWATLLTAPLTLAFFGQLAPWTVLLTPLLAPLVAVLLCGGLAVAVGGGLLPWLGSLLGPPLHAVAALYDALVRAADQLPGTPIHRLGEPAPWALGLLGAVAAVRLLHRPVRARGAEAALWLSLPHFVPAPASGRATLQLFAVGHGQSCLVTTAAGHHTAIDCGSLQLPFVASSCLASALPRHRLDLLVVTHADQDHHNGVATLLASVHIARAVLPAALRESPLVDQLRRHGATVETVPPGTTTSLAPHVTVHAPWVPAGASDNDGSLWVSVQVGNRTALATGDAEELGVAAVLAHGFAAPHDVLVLPHHGRANLLGPRLLQRVRPVAALASAATADGDTALGAIARRCGAELWLTGHHGHLTLDGHRGIITGTTARQLPQEPSLR
jgi:competence protein ComEC